MNHPNILSIEGVAPEPFGFNVVSRWMEHGNILEYVRGHPGIDRLNLACSDALATRSGAYWALADRSHLWSGLPAQQRDCPRRFEKCTWVFLYNICYVADLLS